MASHNDDAGLTEIVVTDPATMQQNELIAQLMQQIAEMKVEMRKTQELANLAITANIPGPDHERPPVHFPSPDPSRQPVPISANPPITPIQTSSVVNLPNPDAGPSNIFSQNPNNIQAGSSSHIAHTIQPQIIPPQNQAPDPYNLPPTHTIQPQIIPSQNQAPDQYNLPSTQTVPPKTPFHIPIFNHPHIPQSAYPEIDHYEEKEREWGAKEEVTRLNMREEITKAMKQFGYAPDVTGLNYEDLCIYPDLNLSEGFKITKFDTFDGSGNPLAHLRAYCDQMVGVGKNETLLMRLFSRTLSGEALEWFTSHETNQWANWSTMAKDFIETFAYNVEIVPDRYSLEKIKQKSVERYREYAYRWRKNTARVRPPMTEKEIIEVFVRSQEPKFYERMILFVGAKFADIVKIGENIEDGLKTGKITNISSVAGTSGGLRKRKEDVATVSGIQSKRRTPDNHPRRPTTSQIPCHPTPASTCQLGYHTPHYQTPHSHYHATQYPSAFPNHQPPLSNCSYVQPISNPQTPQSNYQTPSYPKFQRPPPPR